MTTSTLANIEYSDEMSGNVVLHRVLPCLVRQTRLLEKKVLFY